MIYNITLTWRFDAVCVSTGLRPCWATVLVLNRHHRIGRGAVQENMAKTASKIENKTNSCWRKKQIIHAVWGHVIIELVQRDGGR